MVNTKNVVGAYSTWEPATKTINIRASTHERLKKHFTEYGCTFDSVINLILDREEAKN
jgi:hypothetical protein